MSLSERETGDILRRVMHLEAGMTELRSEVKAVDSKVDGILSQIASVRGGMAVAIWMSGVIGAVGMFALTKIVPLFIGVLPKL